MNWKIRLKLSVFIAGAVCVLSARAQSQTILRPRMIAGELPVPKISEVARVDRDGQAPPDVAMTSTYILKTSPHPTLGDAYLIVTDQTEEGFLSPLERLAKFHQGTIIHVKNLGRLANSTEERGQLINQLREARPRFVAIAPKLEHYSEQMLLGMWDVLASLDDHGQLPVFPGLLVAPDQSSFAGLVDRSIAYRPQPTDKVHPFVMGQVMGPYPPGQRSLQKVRMMRNLFAEYGSETPSLVVRAYTAVQMGTAVAPAPRQWQVDMSGPGQFVQTIPADAKQALDDASLVVMFGHGTDGMACSLDAKAFHDVKMTGKVVLCGACESAAPAARADGPQTRNDDESFAMRAVENGAVVVFAHMRLNDGFPHLFPVLENWMDGLTAGEAYQRLINALKTNQAGEQGNNALLYVVIGDPALQPLEKMKQVASQAGL